MRTKYRCWMALVTCYVFACSGWSYAETDEECHQLLDEWANDPNLLGTKADYALLDALRAEMWIGDARAIESLLEIAKFRECTLFSRTAAIHMACEYSDRESAGLIVQALSEMWDETPGKRNGIVQYAISNFSDRLADSDRSTELVELAVRMGLDINDPSCTQRYEIILNEDCPDELRRERIMGMIRSAPSDFVPLGFLDCLTVQDAIALRPLVLNHKSTDARHWTAIRVLAHFGDPVVLAYLKRWRAADSTLGRTERGWVDLAIWRIEIQHPPTKLLECLRYPEKHAYESPRWFISRAAELLPVDDVRIALEDYFLRVGKQRYVGGSIRQAVEASFPKGIMSKQGLEAFGVVRQRPTW